MNGKRTLISLAVGLVSLVCAAFGIDFGAALSSSGLTPDQVTDAAASETPGWLNLVIGAVAIIAAAFFRMIATKSLLRYRPLDPPAPKDYGGFVRPALLPWLAVIALTAMLAGCAGTPKPVVPASVKQSIASAYIAIGAARGTTADLLSTDTITLEQALDWSADLNKATQDLDLATDALYLGDIAKAETMRLTERTRAM